jgi:acyl carrier protein
MSDVRAMIHEVLRDVAEEEQASTDIRDDAKLVEDLGFRSLSMARILAILEGRLNVDPFSQHVAVTSIRTVDDLCAAYEKCLAGASATEDHAAALEQSRRRATNRRDAIRGRSDQEH